MSECELSNLKRGTFISVLIMLPFVLWAELNPEHLVLYTKEDGAVENLTAIMLLAASFAFAVAAIRSRYLKHQQSKILYFFILGWSILMFVGFGEEISWGQRMFGFETPELLAGTNLQNEFNLHNLKHVESFYGGQHRYLSLMTLFLGLVLPLLVLWKPGRGLVQKTAFPVTPVGYGVFFVGVYVFGRWYQPALGSPVFEVRELLFAIAMLLFAGHGAIRPCILFRICDRYPD